MLARICIVGFVLTVVTPHAAASGVDSLINKLPDPSKLSKSPLETAIASEDPMFKDPEFLKFKKSMQGSDTRSALRALRILTAKYPDKPGLQFARGACALAMHELGEAETCFRGVTTVKGPAAALGWFGIGGVRERQGRTTETVAALRQSVAIQPKFALGWLFLCNIEARQGHTAEGADAARHLTSLQPKFALGWGLLGYCESSQKKYADAITDYRHAISVAPRYAFAYEGLGICYTVTNRPADAVAPLKTALALAPRDYLAATELGYCYLRCGQYADCIDACHQATAVRPGYSKAWDVMGLCYRHIGKKREALEAFRHAAENSPNDPAIRAHYAEASKAAGRA